MENEGGFVASIISENLKLAKKKKGLTTKVIADFLDIPIGTFESYLYGLSVPPLDVLIWICNYFMYSINAMLKPLVPADNEQRYILQIRSCLKDQQDFIAGQIHHVFSPVIQAFMEEPPIFNKEKLGKRIRILRESCGISVIAFAEKVYIASGTLKQIESNQKDPGISTFCRICDNLCVTPEYLLAPSLQYLSEEDRLLYSMTPRQLRALSESIARCIVQLK